jgi:hypothetical protein
MTDEDWAAVALQQLMRRCVACVIADLQRQALAWIARPR